MTARRPTAAGLIVVLLAWVGVVRVSIIMWPTTLPLKVEAVFGATTVDLFPFFLKQEIRIIYGAQNENTAVQAASIAFEIDNPDSHFTPDHPMSDYWPYVKQGVPIQVSVYWNGAWHIRFTGQASEWNPYWPAGDLSDEMRGRKGEARVTVVASGILRQMAQGKSPLRSPLYRTMVGAAEHWSLEDGPDATAFVSAVGGEPGIGRISTSGTAPPEPSGHDGIVGSAAAAFLPAGSAIDLPVRTYVDTGQWVIPAALVVDGDDVDMFIMAELDNGSRVEVNVQNGLTSDLSLAVRVLDVTGTEVYFDETDLSGETLVGQPLSLVFADTDTGGGDDFVARVLDGTGTIRGELTTTNIGYSTVHQIIVLNDWDPAEITAGASHVGLFTDPAFDIDVDTVGIARAVSGWSGEQAHERIERLCTEAGIAVTIIGDESALMGPQQIDILYNLLAMAAQVDVGSLHEDREALALVYRCNRTFYDQDAALTLSARRNEITNPFRPKLDDLNVRNDVAVQRINGSEYRSIVETGPKSVQPYPDGVGTFDEKPILNLYTDEQARFNATWRTWRGTWPGMRYARISLDINASPDIAEGWMAVGVGDRIDVTDLPPQHPRSAVESLMRGYTETLTPTSWSPVVNASPAGPYRVGQAGDGSNAGAWLQTGPATALAAEMKPGDTSITVTPDGALFDTTANLTLHPLELNVDGDIQQVTSISGAGPTQTFVVQRTYPQLRRAAGTIVQVNNPLIACL